MKKILIVLIIGLLVLAGCSTSPVNEVINKLDDKESFVFVLASSTCSACLTYRPIINEFMEQKDMEIIYIEVDKTDNDTLQTLVNDYLEGDLEFTPTTYVILEGEMVDTAVGSITYSDLVALFEKYELLEN